MSLTWSDVSSVLIPFAYIDMIFLFDILAYACLVLLKKLRLKFAFSVSGYGESDVSETGAKSFSTVYVAAVVCVFILVSRTWNSRVHRQARLQGRFSMNSAIVSLKSS